LDDNIYHHIMGEKFIVGPENLQNCRYIYIEVV